jgi:hypothetical protein
VSDHSRRGRRPFSQDDRGPFQRGRASLAEGLEGRTRTAMRILPARQIMSAAALLSQTPHPTRSEIVAHMSGNICRCGTYPGIVRAIERAAKGA